MEQSNREKIIEFNADLAHIKKDVSEIKDSIAIFIQTSQKIENEIVDLRARSRELEREVVETKTGLNELKGLLWKLFVGISAGSAGTIGVWEILSK